MYFVTVIPHRVLGAMPCCIADARVRIGSRWRADYEAELVRGPYGRAELIFRDCSQIPHPASGDRSVDLA